MNDELTQKTPAPHWSMSVAGGRVWFRPSIQDTWIEPRTEAQLLELMRLAGYVVSKPEGGLLMGVGR